MATQAVKFTADSAARIAAVVRNAEGQSADQRGRRRRTPAAVDSLPDPQYQYQVLQAVSQNQIGFGFVCAHAMEDDDDTGGT